MHLHLHTHANPNDITHIICKCDTVILHTIFDGSSAPKLHTFEFTYIDYTSFTLRSSSDDAAAEAALASQGADQLYDAVLRR